MSISNQYCKTKFYNQFNSANLINKINNKLEISLPKLTKEMTYIIFEILCKSPNYYFSKSVFKQTYLELEKLFHENEDKIFFDETMFESLIMGYDAYKNISETIKDLRNFNINSGIKTRLYRLPTYTSIIESCLGNLLRPIAIMVGSTKGKDYSTQNTIAKLKNVLSSNNFTAVSENINENIRNSINHGRVVTINGAVIDTLRFYYTENHIIKSVEYKLYEFDKIIDDIYDTTSAVLLALSLFLNNHINIIHTPTRKDLLFRFLAMRFSLPGILCTNINDIDNNKQINIEFQVNKTDKGYLSQLSVMVACMIYEYFPGYEKYLIGFRNKRMLPGHIRFTKNEVSDMFKGVRKYDDVMLDVIKKDFLIYDKSEEIIDESEYKYFVFPNITEDTYSIREIYDSSLADRKRLRAKLFIGNIDNKEDILKIIEDAINKLKNVKNPPNPKLQIKHGAMEADSLYINVYKEDLRANKEILKSNENFVCFVDYNLNGETTLKNGGLPPAIWNSLYKENDNLINIAWRESKYITVHHKKIGRNELCPCGSGKKFKRCCGR